MWAPTLEKLDSFCDGQSTEDMFLDIIVIFSINILFSLLVIYLKSEASC